MKQMQVFNNGLFGDVRFVEVDEKIYAVASDVAKALGYSNPHDAVSRHCKGIVKHEVPHPQNKNKDLELNIIPEGDIYRLIFKSKLPQAEQFESWVMDEVLPQLRSAGVVILEHAEPEAISFESVYGKRRVRKSIREAKDTRKLFEDYIELSAIERNAKRITNKDRINTLNIFIDELENKLANEAINMRGSELLATQELLTDIHKEKTRLHNKANGGIKSAQTKKIAQLEQELSNNESDDELDWKTVNNHGFTENLRLEYSPQLQRMVRTRAYNAWRNNFDYSDCKPLNCDTTKPMIIYLHFGKLAKFDTSNLEKSAIDMISDYYGFNDNLIISKVTTSEVVSTYKDGFIMFDLINV